MWEAPVGGQRTSVGLDVHARSIVACGLDAASGELFERRLVPASREVLSWIAGLPGPVAVTYEAGPTGSSFLDYRWPTTPRWTPCWPRWTVGLDSTRRSHRWPPRAAMPRW